MSEKPDVIGGASPATMFSFRDRFTTSPQFLDLFREGMSLVEETAGYLDGVGRQDARRLTPPTSLAYTTESMKLTTRLMQMASWLLLRRAVANGEITAEAALDHRRRVRLAAQSIAQPEGYDGLPETLKRLIGESYKLHSRLLRLDHLMENGSTLEAAMAAPAASPLENHLERIRLAFPAA